MDIKTITNLINDKGLDISETINFIFFNDYLFKLYFISNYDDSFEKPSKRLKFITQLAFNDTLLHFGFHYIILGCSFKFKKITMKPCEIFNLDLSTEIGNGKLLYINYTSEGTIVPVEIHGNCPMNNEYKLNKQLYPVVYNNNIPKESSINILYVYLPEKLANDLIQNHLIEAFSMFIKHDYISQVIKLQIVAEFLIDKFLKTYKSNKKERTANYCRKLKQIFPQKVIENNFIPCPQYIIDELNTMRLRRNEISHNGGYAEISDDEAKKWIISTFLLFKYFKVIHNII